MIRKSSRQPAALALTLGAVLLAAAGAATATAAAATSAVCAVAFHVQVPKSTKTVYISGNVPALGPWAANKVALTGTGTTRSVVVKMPAGTSLEYKFTEGDWSTVEVAAGGKDIDNRKFTVPSAPTARVAVTVAAWHTPAAK